VTVLDGPIPVRATWEEMALTPAGKAALLDYQLRPRTRTRRSTGGAAPRPKSKAGRTAGATSMPAAAKHTRAGQAKPDPTPVVVERMSLEVVDELGRLMRPPAPAVPLTATDLAGPPHPGPPQPTAAYSLVPPNKVCWEGREVELPPQPYQLLSVLLNHRNWPVPFDAVESVVKDEGKNVSNVVSRLNAALETISFPWNFYTKHAHIDKR
jgi:hypothetical protein